MKKFALTLAASAVLCLTGLAVAAAPASADGVQDEVDRILVEFPGGTQIDDNVIVWEGGTVRLDLANDEFPSRAVGTCATGNFCAWSGTGLTGSKLSFSACGSYSTAALGTTRSVANARTSKNVSVKNSSGTVLATLAPGASDGTAPTSTATLACVS